MPPVWVLTAMMIFDIFGVFPLVPRAVRDGRVSEVFILVAGALVGLPAGMFLLTRIGADEFRLLISVAALILVVLLASGWRVKRALSQRAKAGVGVIAGTFGGATGAPGPPIILLYLSGPIARQSSGRTTCCSLSCSTWLSSPCWPRSVISKPEPIMIGVVLTLPYAFAGWLGQMIFDPQRERFYRNIAYAIIALSALIGLPVFGW